MPLDAQLAANALNQALRDSGVRLVFTTRGDLQRLQTVSDPTGELQPFKPGIGILLERFQTLAAGCDSRHESSAARWKVVAALKAGYGRVWSTAEPPPS